MSAAPPADARNTPAAFSRHDAALPAAGTFAFAHDCAAVACSPTANNASAATRQLAKRQLTWLRSTENMTEFDCLTENVSDLVLEYIRQELEAMIIDSES